VALTYKFAKKSHVGIFHNERTLPLDWTPNSCFGAFWTVSLLHKSRCKTGRTGTIIALVGSAKSRRNFSQRTHRSTPLDPRLKFWGVSDRFITARKSMQNWPNSCHYRTSSVNNVASEFFVLNTPDPLHLTQNSCLGAFQTVLLLYECRCKTGRTGAINAQVR
jgi:hypothetical protein